MTRQAIEPVAFPFFDYRRYAFSLGIAVGDGVWLAGHTAARHDPALAQMTVRGGLGEQAQASQEKQRLILSTAGLGFEQVVKLTDYITPAGLAAYDEIRAVREPLYGSRPPAVSTVVVEQLLRHAALIETEVVAARGPIARYGDDRGPGGQPAACAVQSEGLVYTSAILPNEATGDAVAGALLAQAAQIYTRAHEILAAAGTSLRNVVRTVEFLTPPALPDYRETWRVRAEHLGPPGSVATAATGVVVPALALPGALMQVEFTAARERPQAIDPGWSRSRRLTYVPAAGNGQTLFISGLLALDPVERRIVSAGDIAGQARAIYGSMSEIMRTAGADLDAIVKTVEYVTPAGLRDYRSTAEVRRECFRTPYPAATGVVCTQLLHPEALIEVDAVAVLPR